MLSREQVERRIYYHMNAIRNLVVLYSPENIYLSAAVLSSGTIIFNNSYWRLPEDQRINFIEGSECE